MTSSVMLFLLFLAAAALTLLIGGIVSAMIWFANEAERQCAMRRDRYDLKRH